MNNELVDMIGPIKQFNNLINPPKLQITRPYNMQTINGKLTRFIFIFKVTSLEGCTLQNNEPDLNLGMY